MAKSLLSNRGGSNVPYPRSSTEAHPDDRTSELGRIQLKPSQRKSSNSTSQHGQKMDHQHSSPPVSPHSSSSPKEGCFKMETLHQQNQPSNFAISNDHLFAVANAYGTQERIIPTTIELEHNELGRSSHEEIGKVLPLLNSRSSRDGSIPVFVMLPLDSIRDDGNSVRRKKTMNVSLRALKTAGVKGVMVDVWWGIVEKNTPGQYNWSGYRELLEMVREHGLKVQAVISFHHCGGNIGDSVNIPLPKWVVEEIEFDNDLAYTDQWGRRNYEYISLGCDNLPVLKGRTPVQCYADCMRSFKENLKDFMAETIVEIQVGMGPAGELRYPSYTETSGTWKFPGIGAFQCYDKYMLAILKGRAEAAGMKEWGHGGPNDAGNYKSWPEDTNFFNSEGGWSSPYGEFFLQWYSDMLLDHGERILAAAKSVFHSTAVRLSGKVACIHWHYRTRSHAPELTAGYYNTQLRDGYLPIATLFAKHQVVLKFTGMEMKDTEQPENGNCSPEKLFKQIIQATQKANVSLAGENALLRFDEAALQQIINNSSLRLGEDNADNKVEPICGFTYFRMSAQLFQTENWTRFVSFVQKMSKGVAISNSSKGRQKDTMPTIREATP